MVDDERSHWLLDRIGAELGGISKSLAYLVGGLGIAAAIVSCNPANDTEALISSCMAEATLHHVDSSYGPLCMSGKGYAFNWGHSSCGIQGTFYFAECYEKRGAWRTTKQWAREAWKWMFHGKKAG